MRSGPVAAIAAYTVREAMRNRLLLLVVVFLVLGFALAQFVAEVAITESAEVRSGFLGALLRVCAVFTVSLFVITSIVREFNDKVVELVLSQPIPRSAYYLGKLVGFAALCVAIALLCGLCLLAVAAPAAVALWTVSLACELVLVAAFSLMCLFTFSQVPAALSAVMAFYVLARAMAALQLIAESPLLPSSRAGQRAVEWLIEGLAFVLPSLERFTQARWLMDVGAGWADLWPVLAQSAIYTAMVSAVALFDLYRRNL
jgi:ABC-type transport system involved in multi-copper enzyme maturation permease subunit